MIKKVSMTDVVLALNKVYIPRVYVWVCDIQSGQLLGKFPTLVNKIALLPVLTKHSLATNLLFCGVISQIECVSLMSIPTICMPRFWVKQYTWHLYKSSHTTPLPWLSKEVWAGEGMCTYESQQSTGQHLKC